MTSMRKRKKKLKNLKTCLFKDDHEKKSKDHNKFRKRKCRLNFQKLEALLDIILCLWKQVKKARRHKNASSKAAHQANDSRKSENLHQHQHVLINMQT